MKRPRKGQGKAPSAECWEALSTTAWKAALSGSENDLSASGGTCRRNASEVLPEGGNTGEAVKMEHFVAPAAE